MRGSSAAISLAAFSFGLCGALFLLLPTEFLRSEEGVYTMADPAAEAPAETSTSHDYGVMHTHTYLPRASALSLNLGFPFRPLGQFVLKFSACAERGDAVLGVALHRGDDGPIDTVRERGLAAGRRDFSIPLWPASRRCTIVLSARAGDVRVDDLRVVPVPWLPALAGFAALIGALALRPASREPAGTPPGRHRRRIAVRVLLFLLMALLVAGSMEAFLRLFPRWRPACVTGRIRSRPLRYFRTDFSGPMRPEELTGIRFKPHSRFQYATASGDTHTGLRDCIEQKEVDAAYDADGFMEGANPPLADVVFLGDSFLAEPRVPHTLCDWFGWLSGLTCANLGHPGMGTFQERNILERYGLPKRPRMVFLVYFEGNDLRDNIRYEGFMRDGMRNPGRWFPAEFGVAPMAFAYTPLDDLLVCGLLPLPARIRLWDRYLIPATAGGEAADAHAAVQGDECFRWGIDNAIELPSIGGGCAYPLPQGTSPCSCTTRRPGP
ncbi:MAG: hypothetical protein PHN82_03995 [bacterium]|nr:hypothetical protein [bacterium]